MQRWLKKQVKIYCTPAYLLDYTSVLLVTCPWSGPVPLNWVAGAASARSCRPDEVLWFLRWHFAHRTLVLISILFCPHITRLSLQQTASWWTVCWLSLDTQRTQHQAPPHRRRQSNNTREEPSDVFGQEDESFSQSNCYLLWGVGVQDQAFPPHPCGLCCNLWPLFHRSWEGGVRAWHWADFPRVRDR